MPTTRPIVDDPLTGYSVPKLWHILDAKLAGLIKAETLIGIESVQNTCTEGICHFTVRIGYHKGHFDLIVTSDRRVGLKGSVDRPALGRWNGTAFAVYVERIVAPAQSASTPYREMLQQLTEGSLALSKRRY